MDGSAVDWFAAWPAWMQWLAGGILIATLLAIVTHDWDNDE